MSSQPRWRPRRVFIHFPAGVRSGGPEALHQLCEALTAHGVDAWLVPLRWPAGRDDVSEYERYGCRIASEVPDDPDVAVVLPDVAASYVATFQQARAVLWWLSIDFSETFGPGMARQSGEGSWGGRFVHAYRVLAPWHAERRTGSLRALLGRASHCAQSEYARRFLQEHEGLSASLLSDYVHLDEQFHYREDPGGPARTPLSVAYNPAKGGRYLAQLRERAPDLVWRPVSGLDREGVGRVLSTSELYVDLGHHPGKDRIPREAALAGCVVVVGGRGSAALAEDVPVDSALRVPVTDDVSETAHRTERVLRSVLAAPDVWRAGQRSYRDWIRGEEQRFRDEVEQVFVRGGLADPRGSGRGASLQPE
jgi:hypothetical protein